LLFRLAFSLSVLLCYGCGFRSGSPEKRLKLVNLQKTTAVIFQKSQNFTDIFFIIPKNVYICDA